MKIKWIVPVLVQWLLETCDTCIHREKYLKETFASVSFTGEVEKVYLDANNRSMPTMKLRFQYPLYSLLAYDYKVINTGDSIFKREEEVSMLLKKIDSVDYIVLLPSCNGFEIK